MKIRFRQSGGLAGLAKVAELEADDSASGEAGRLRALVDDALAQPLPESGPAMPDEEQIYVEIEIAQRRRTILVGRSSIPGPVRPLVEYLQEIAQYEKRR
jgi:hypothetical protein